MALVLLFVRAQLGPLNGKAAGTLALMLRLHVLRLVQVLEYPGCSLHLSRGCEARLRKLVTVDHWDAAGHARQFILVIVGHVLKWYLLVAHAFLRLLRMVTVLNAYVRINTALVRGIVLGRFE